MDGKILETTTTEETPEGNKVSMTSVGVQPDLL